MSVKPQPGPLAHLNLSMPTVRGPVDTAIKQTFGADGALEHFRLEVAVSFFCFVLFCLFCLIFVVFHVRFHGTGSLIRALSIKHT
jgi:hypothetical protein